MNIWERVESDAVCVYSFLSGGQHYCQVVMWFVDIIPILFNLVKSTQTHTHTTPPTIH